jgi:hypothetical protein
MRICKISGRDALDALAHLADGPARPDERRRAIAPDPRELRRSSQRALDLQHERGDMGRRFQQLTRPSIERTARIEYDLDPVRQPPEYLPKVLPSRRRTSSADTSE